MSTPSCSHSWAAAHSGHCLVPSPHSELGVTRLQVGGQEARPRPQVTGQGLRPVPWATRWAVARSPARPPSPAEAWPLPRRARLPVTL